jgi:hypothetical protein
VFMVTRAARRLGARVRDAIPIALIISPTV